MRKGVRAICEKETDLVSIESLGGVGGDTNDDVRLDRSEREDGRNSWFGSERSDRDVESGTVERTRQS